MSDVKEWVEPLNDPFITFLFGVLFGAALMLLLAYYFGGFSPVENNAPRFHENMLYENIELALE